MWLVLAPILDGSVEIVRRIDEGDDSTFDDKYGTNFDQFSPDSYYEDDPYYSTWDFTARLMPNIWRNAQSALQR